MSKRATAVGVVPTSPKEHWRTYLERKGLKTTQQREAIVDAFLRSSGHVALEDLLSSARRKHPRVGLATVYRTVKLLEEAGIAAARHFGPGQTLYEVAEGRAHHDHLICDSCGFIIEFESDEIEQLQDSAARRLGFNVLRHRHELFGLCERARGVPGGACPGMAAGRFSAGDQPVPLKGLEGEAQVRSRSRASAARRGRV
ncbi:MAG TPA: transcriptional repressor [Polyangia bacterium]|nr:transcriptional repressor [Polyangia bacterium]